MRLIRLSSDYFQDIAAVRDHLLNPQSSFRNRGPFATFCFTEGRIAENGLRPGESVLFSYEGSVVFVATAWSGRMPWSGPGSGQLPYCFQVNLAG